MEQIEQTGIKKRGFNQSGNTSFLLRKTLPTSQVALQHCPILSAGKSVVILSYLHSYGKQKQKK